MNLQQVRLGLVLKEAGVELAVRQFDQRLILQKAIHLLQEGGVHLGYHFRWYLRGPYSPRLTEDVFAVAALPEKGAGELKDWKLDEESKQKVAKFNGLFAASSTGVLAKHLELLSSILFLVRTGQGDKANPAGITATLQKHGKKFDLAEVIEGLHELVRYEFAV